jgi:hypothetical protein
MNKKNNCLLITVYFEFLNCQKKHSNIKSKKLKKTPKTQMN